MVDETVMIEVPSDKANLLLGLVEAIDKGDRTGLGVLNKQATSITNNRKMLTSIQDGSYKETSYMSRDEVNTAYKHALDAPLPPTPEDCFNVVLVHYGVTEDYLKEAKDKPTFHVKDVLKANATNPKAVEMNKNRILDIKSLKKSSTPNQLINSITTRRSVNDRLEKLEQEVEDLKSRVTNTELGQVSNELAIESITLALTPNIADRRKENAITLKHKNYTNKEIAKILKVDQRTVRRYLNEVTNVRT
jgi:hypothetical protein